MPQLTPLHKPKDKIGATSLLGEAAHGTGVYYTHCGRFVCQRSIGIKSYDVVWHIRGLTPQWKQWMVTYQLARPYARQCDALQHVQDALAAQGLLEATCP